MAHTQWWLAGLTCIGLHACSMTMSVHIEDAGPLTLCAHMHGMAVGWAHLYWSAPSRVKVATSIRPSRERRSPEAETGLVAVRGANGSERVECEFISVGEGIAEKRARMSSAGAPFFF